MFQRTRQKLALGYTAVMAAILVGFGYGLTLFLQAVLLQGVDSALAQTAQEVERSLPVQLRGQRWEVLVQSPFFQPGGAYYVQWFTPEQQLARSTLEGYTVPLTPRLDYQTIRTDQRYRQLTRPWVYEGQTLGYLRVMQSLTQLDRVLEQLSWSLWLGIPLTIVVIGGGGWVLAGVAMAPIRAAFDQLQQFTADASHELRTPIAAIQTNAQVLLGTEATTEDYQRGLESIERMSRRMGSLVNDLLFLVRNDQPAPTGTAQAVNLGELLQQVSEEQTPVAQKAGIHLELKILQNGLVQGEPDQLARLVLNLLSNALCYT
ncbi:cell wall metabolism sensor histidine kinase WalK, partial [Candidatus Cyanaurora vandensis]